MGLLSLFKHRVDAAPADTATPADAVQQARARARRRLIGAVVLLGIGIVGFPLVFETQPRSILVDIPIEVPRKEGVPPLAMPAGRTPGATSPSASSTAPMAAPSMRSSDVITESRADAGRDVAASATASAPAPEPVARAASNAPAVARVEAAPKPAAEARPALPNDTARVKALLEGKPPVRDDAGRFVVQVGAFADAAAARETRLKVEKLGLKTYTQVASTSSGERIRVRVGPFGSRDEADKALAKARAAGLTAVVLTL
jgi:DedD protein